MGMKRLVAMLLALLLIFSGAVIADEDLKCPSWRNIWMS